MRPGPWLWVAVVLNTILGVWLSPITAAWKVRVIGASPLQERRLKEAVAQSRAIPALRFDPNPMLSIVRQDPAIESATWNQNVFGRAILRLKLRTPVAVVNEQARLVLGDTGELYVAPAVPVGLPVLSPPIDATKPSFVLAGNWSGRIIAQLANNLRKQIPDRDFRIVQDSSNKVSLTSAPDTAQVVLGSTDKMDEKVITLRKALEQQPNLLSQVKVLNISAPSNPVIIPIGR
ncbi:MAG: hypothetical protein JST40_03740 [Armatimonadetes bacterium]|nr:hypothetical protein [Armatimonadota bacterium]